MTDLDPDVLVLGAGVIGLSTAICLAEAGLSVTVAAADPPRRTTSVAAGAIWGPHLVGMDDRVERWAGLTLDRLTELSHPELGANELAGVVHIAAGVAASRDGQAAPPEFAATAGSLSRCAPGEVPAGYGAAWRLTATMVAMPGYLDYLAARFGRAGGTSTFPEKIAALSDARRLAPSARVIVNCTGCGARDLVPDPDVDAGARTGSGGRQSGNH